MAEVLVAVGLLDGSLVLAVVAALVLVKVLLDFLERRQVWWPVQIFALQHYRLHLPLPHLLLALKVLNHHQTAAAVRGART